MGNSWLRYFRGPVDTHPLAGRILGYGSTPVVGAILVARILVALNLVQRHAAVLYLGTLLVVVSAVNFVYLVSPRHQQA